MSAVAPVATVRRRRTKVMMFPAACAVLLFALLAVPIWRRGADGAALAYSAAAGVALTALAFRTISGLAGTAGSYRAEILIDGLILAFGLAILGVSRS